MTEKRFKNVGKDILQYGGWWCSANGEHCADVIATAMNELIEENEQLKTTISRLIEQNRKNNDLLVSDIRLLEKALWCPNCTRNIKRLKELKKEFEND